MIADSRLRTMNGNGMSAKLDGSAGFLGLFFAKCGVKFRPHIFGQRYRLGSAENLDSFPGLVDHHAAVFAMIEMALEFRGYRGVEFAVDIIRNLANDAFAIQLTAPWRK